MTSVASQSGRGPVIRVRGAGCRIGHVRQWETAIRWNRHRSNTRALPYHRADRRSRNLNPKLERTRKLSYRKDDRTMSPIYRCPENFRESLSTPTATFPENFSGLLVRSILWMCVQNLKFVALPVPGIIVGYSENLGNPWIHPRSLFS